jgi:hypothetical protein
MISHTPFHIPFQRPVLEPCTKYNPKLNAKVDTAQSSHSVAEGRQSLPTYLPESLQEWKLGMRMDVSLTALTTNLEHALLQLHLLLLFFSSSFYPLT